MAIRVKTNNNTTTVRVGQQNAIKVVASNQSVGTVDQMSNVGDVNITDRATNTVMLFNGTEYVHVTAAQILDLADNTDDDAIDYGGF